LAAVVWWLIGFLPWIVSGLEAPVVSGAVDGDAGVVRIAVPLLTVTLGTLLVGTLIGGVGAGLLALTAASRRWWAAAATVTGVLLAVVVTVVQSAVTLGDVAPGFSGGVVIGDVPSFRADQMPYGGVKDSGTGREGVHAAMEDLTEERVLVLTGIAV
jgi:hypothetical protein